MQLTIKFIGALRHITGKTNLSLNFQTPLTIKTLLTTLTQELPPLKPLFTDLDLNAACSNSLILVNGKEISAIAGYETLLCEGDEVVFVPVVHGG
jgi:molybdopterin converting factor small subunit